MIVVSSDTEPGERYMFDRDTKELTKQYQRLREAAAGRTSRR